MKCLNYLLCCVVASSLAGEEIAPLGLVEQVQGDVVQVVYTVAPGALPAQMLAIYGPGAVHRHPLTGEVVTEARRLMARAQMVQLAGTSLTARVLWRAPDAQIEPGFDVVCVPGEALPDAPPALSGVLTARSLAPGVPVDLHWPLSDPEGGPLSLQFSLLGDPGRVGLLAWTQSTAPTVRYLPSARSGPHDIAILAQDAAGQQARFVQALDTLQAAQARPERPLSPWADRGGEGPWPTRLLPSGNGALIGLAGNLLIQADPTCAQVSPLPLSREAGVRQPLALVERQGQRHVLDGAARSVVVLAADGSLVARYGSCQNPTDLALSSDGTAFIADQGRGGVLVYQEDGRLRAVLGAGAEGEDGFVGLTRIAVDRLGNLFALDPARALVERFTAQHQRLSSWRIPVPERLTVLDLALSEGRVLLLMSDGQILAAGADGVFRSWAVAAVDSGLIARLGAPAALSVVGQGRVLVHYPSDRVLARYEASGACSGLASPNFFLDGPIAADARGRLALAGPDAVIAIFDTEGFLVRRLGGLQRAGGPFSDAPEQLAFRPDGGALFALDRDQGLVVRLDPDDAKAAPLFLGRRGTAPGEFDDPVDLCVDEQGRCYVIDEDLHQVSIFAGDGAFISRLGGYERGKTADELIAPSRIAVHPDGSLLTIYDAKRYECMQFALEDGGKQWRHLGNSGGRGTEPGRFSRLVSLHSDRYGLLYAVDSGRRDIQVLDLRSGQMVVVQVLPLAERGLSGVQQSALNPDGLLWLMYNKRWLGLSW